MNLKSWKVGGRNQYRGKDMRMEEGRRAKQLREFYTEILEGAEYISIIYTTLLKLGECK